MTQKEALILSETSWWKHATDDEVVRFQLFEPRLCMPEEEFREALETILGREVITEEFWCGIDALKAEYLEAKDPPTDEELAELLIDDILFTPEEELSTKRRIVITPVNEDEVEFNVEEDE